MDKINAIGIQGSQMQLMQEMQRMASASGSRIDSSSISFSAAPSTEGVAFSQVFNQAINNVDSQQHRAGAMQTAIDTGVSDDLMGTMLESQKASVAFSAMLEVRNKLTTALDQVMNISL